MIATFSEEGQIRSLTQDPKVDYLVALAFNGETGFLISEDAHLLALDEAAGLEGHTVRVAIPREFLQELG